MKALFYPAYNQLSISERPAPEIKEDEVLLRVLACGICSSEIETFKHQSIRRVPPLIMGHEFCGEIIETGSKIENFEPGDRVVSNSVVSCGQCSTCRRGNSNLCANRQVFGMHRFGAFAELVNVPAKSLVKMPESLSPEIACLAEPLANGIHMVHLARHLNPKKVLIIGAGAIGLFAQQAFQALADARVWVADLRDERLAVALENGAEMVLNPLHNDLVAEIHRRTGDEGVDLVIDAVGTEKTNQQALSAVRPGGMVVLIGLYENSRSLSSYDIVLPEKHVTGTYAATDNEIQEAVTLLASGKINATSWINYYTLDDGVRAFHDMMEAKESHIKSVILFN